MQNSKENYGRGQATNSLINEYWKIRLNQFEKCFTHNQFGFSAVENLAEAKNLVLNTLLPESKAKTVSFGGSMTVVDSGLYDAIKSNKSYQIYDTYDSSLSYDERIEIRRQSLLADAYISSVNAITEKGELILLDAIGNRNAAVQFGPKKVFLLIGRNKICKDVHEASHRIKSFAAPVNAKRLNRKTPCVKTGYCMDCNSPDRICATWTRIVRSIQENRIHVILINQDVGY